MIGHKIKQLRKLKGLTQQELIDGLFDRSYLSNIERGKITPPIETLAMLANRLNVPTDQLIDYRDTERIVREMLDTAEQTDNINLLRQAWDASARVQSVELMTDCAIQWAKCEFKSGHATVELLEAIHHTIMLINSLNEHIENEIEIIFCKGNTYFYLGMFDEAIWVYRELLKRSLSTDLLVRVKISLGSALMKVMQYQIAFNEFSEVLDLMPQSKLQQARVYQGLGACGRYLRNFSLAITQLETAADLYSECDHDGYIQTMHTLGVIWLDKLNFAKSKEYFTKVENHYLTHNMQDNTALLYEEFARAEFYRENYESANLWCNKGLELANGLNAPLAGTFYLWKSWVYHFTGATAQEFDAWMAAKSLLGTQLNNTLQFIDPNMKQAIKDKLMRNGCTVS